MPLPDPVARRPLHTRAMTMTGHIRDDGLWDIDGHILDTKHYDHETDWRGAMPAGTPVHEMHVRLTIDDDMLIHGCEVVFDHHPFPTCTGAAPNFAALEGVRIGPGWMRAVRQRVGGRRGCTHVIEMLSQMGTTAYQTFVAKRRVKGVDTDPTFGNPDAKPFLIDSCHGMAADGPVVKKSWPRWYAGPAGNTEGPEGAADVSSAKD